MICIKKRGVVRYSFRFRPPLYINKNRKTNNKPLRRPEGSSGGGVVSTPPPPDSPLLGQSNTNKVIKNETNG